MQWNDISIAILKVIIKMEYCSSWVLCFEWEMIKYYKIESNAWKFHMAYELWGDLLLKECLCHEKFNVKINNSGPSKE